MKPTEKRQVTTLTKKTGDLLASTVMLTVEDDTQLKGASSMLGEVKTIAKELKASKEAITKPLNAALKEVRDLFRVSESNLADAEKVLKGAILAYHDAQKAIADKEVQKIENRMGEGRGHIRTETAMAKLANVEQPETNLAGANGGAQIKMGPAKVRITNALLLIQDHPSILQSERVLEALRMELQAEVRMGGRVPQGAEIYQERLVAGVTA
jgi:hypothetical protein